MESSISEFRNTPWIRIHSETNSSSWVVFVILFCSALIQKLFVSSCATVLFFLCTSSKSCGARFRGASPSSQAWCQNLVFLPLPIVMVVDALKKKRSISVHGISRPDQGLLSALHSCHIHRAREGLYQICQGPKLLVRLGPLAGWQWAS